MALPKKALTAREDYAATIDDGKALRALIVQLAKAWGVSVKDATARCLRMGANRYAALNRHKKKVVKLESAKSRKPSPKRPAPKASPRAAKRASAAPKPGKRPSKAPPALSNGVATHA